MMETCPSCGTSWYACWGDCCPACTHHRSTEPATPRPWLGWAVVAGLLIALLVSVSILMSGGPR